MAMEKNGFFAKLKGGLSRTRDALSQNLDALLFGKKILDADLFEQLEDLLISADLGPRFTRDLLDEVQDKIKRRELDNVQEVKKILRERMLAILAGAPPLPEIRRDKPHVIMVVGVNGSGKTTTIGKMAHLLRSEDHEVMLVAADTFRAAAIEQLEIWGKRVGAPVIRQKMNADPAAVVFDALAKISGGYNGIMIIDTAGRLHTKINLMEELKKIKRVISGKLPGAPQETLLVLDATTGQNALAQAKMFKEEIGVNGIVLTKLDGTSKGAVVVRIVHDLALPVRYIGVGEGIEDLREFVSEDFIKAIVD